MSFTQERISNLNIKKGRLEAGQVLSSNIVAIKLRRRQIDL